MTKDEALVLLAEAGLEEADAVGSLDAALKDFRSVNELLAAARGLKHEQVLNRFGQDGARAVAVLRAKNKGPIIWTDEVLRAEKVSYERIEVTFTIQDPLTGETTEAIIIFPKESIPTLKKALA